jgi:hypothetical protein
LFSVSEAVGAPLRKREVIAAGEQGIVFNRFQLPQARRHLSMPLDGTIHDIEADFEILETIGAHVDGMIEKLMTGGALQKTLRRWLIGHAEAPEGEDARRCLMAMAADLELFTPSMSGRTLVDRHLNARSPDTPQERLALQALGAAQFRLVRIVEREGPDLIRLKDLVTEASLLLLDARISPIATGLPTVMRLCPLASGRHVVISPLFAMDEAMLDVAMKFVHPGRPLGHGHRCAARLYQDVARRGFCPLPQLTMALDQDALVDFLREAQERLTPVERLAMRWIMPISFLRRAAWRRWTISSTLSDVSARSTRTRPRNCRWPMNR